MPSAFGQAMENKSQADGGYADLKREKAVLQKALEAALEVLWTVAHIGGDQVLLVQWEYEDKLPSDLEPDDYGPMYDMSRVDGVRLFPYVYIGGRRFYLKSDHIAGLDDECP